MPTNCGTRVKPELLADGPSQVWTWDITKLRGPAKGNFYQLYVLIEAKGNFYQLYGELLPAVRAD